MYISDTNRELLFEIVHSNNSNIPENIKKNLIFCITKRINTVVVDIMSNTNSFIMLLLEADPLITVQNTIPKSINKLTGIVKINSVNKKKPPNAHKKMLVCKISKKIAENTKIKTVKKNNIEKK